MRAALAVAAMLALSAGPTTACVPKAFTLYFDAAGATLRDGQGPEWAALVAVTRQEDLAQLQLRGSADRSLGEMAYRQLARERIDVILTQLSEAGAPVDRIDHRVLGDEASLTGGPASLTDAVLSNYVEAIPLFAGPQGALIDGCGRLVEEAGQ